MSDTIGVVEIAKDSIQLTLAAQAAIAVTAQTTNYKVEVQLAGAEGPQGPKGDTEYVGNLDGGGPDSIYGGLEVIDGGSL